MVSVRYTKYRKRWGSISAKVLSLADSSDDEKGSSQYLADCSVDKKGSPQLLAYSSGDEK